MQQTTWRTQERGVQAWRQGAACMTLGLLVLPAVGCQSLAEPPPPEGSLVIPVDRRAPHLAETPPPPITGGTLAVARHPGGVEGGRLLAVAADPDRDRISVVDLDNRQLLHTIALEPGDEPGRVTFDADGNAHVALRRGGDVVSLDPLSGELLARRAVCPSPRGITFDAQAQALWIACASGQLVQLSPDSEPASERFELLPDLRDVVVDGETLRVSRYKSGEVLTVSRSGALLSRSEAPDVRMMRSSPVAPSDPDALGSPPTLREASFATGVAWRMVGDDAGQTWMLHQAALSEEVPTEPPDEGDGAPGRTASPYGGSGGGCEAIVQSAVSKVEDTGPRRWGMALAQVVLAVDVAVSPQAQQLALALPGRRDPDAPRPFIRDTHAGVAPTAPPGFGTSSVAVVHAGAVGELQEPMHCIFPTPVEVPGQATAVAYLPSSSPTSTQLLVQTREPAQLVLADSPAGRPEGSLQGRVVDLGGESRLDTGHELFHRDAGAGVACASCHGEGGDDGHTWLFAGMGPRRTQSLYVGLEGTAPFHWDGTLPDVAELMDEVFVGRMGGARQSEPRLDALTRWMFALEPPAPMVAADDPNARRGEAIFHSRETGCTDCHNGERLTDSESYVVGTAPGDERFQVPSLRAVGYRAPFLHTGCASTLKARFDPECGGGDQHGHTSQLSEAELDDLVAYMRSL